MLEDVGNDVNDPINIVNCVNDIISIIIGVVTENVEFPHLLIDKHQM